MIYFSYKQTLADWQFRSRPDLSPPKLNITLAATEETAPGYLFVAPYSGYADVQFHGPRQAAPYVFTDQGELVWSGFAFFSIWAANFQAAKYKGEDILFSFEGSHNPAYGHGHGHVTFLNKNLETVKEIRAGNHKILDKHEFHIKDEKTALIEIYHPVPRDLTKYGASSEQQWIVDARVQELDLETGEVLFEWSSLEHINPSESILPINPGYAGSGYNSSDAWDYFHINSVDKDEDGNYVISARHTAALYKINGKTGEIIWKLGGLPGKISSDFKSIDDFTFAFQHHARILSTSPDKTKQVISFFDNSAHGSEDTNGTIVHYAENSSGKIIEVDIKSWEAKLLKQYNPPEKILAKSQGSTQVLPNGNVIVNWGSEGALTEFNADGKPIFHTYLDSGDLGARVQNYRGFKYNWTSIPFEKIAVFSEVTKEDDTIIYVSWNGDIDTKTWRLFTLSSDGKREYVAETKRTGFETTFKITGEIHERVAVEAIDNNGKILATSDITVSEKQVLPYAKKPVTEVEHTETGFQNFFTWKIGLSSLFNDEN
ncbi:hypothetical protein PACTADRAFT_76154 [Pachysolen tannophilus NRRL Y-2460]|uniref:Arylsulfotransferase N-terminal domain-containing protein n=1 Tax=Pachysolen tannophilus NRRL Y-2460 TaxID=669874 RepID=A0A1E4TVE1_PACTA|nr:hypothetical protein PACTADRAFT_76154 [Pachysolen tannophilus NRRL Y-2460]